MPTETNAAAEPMTVMLEVQLPTFTECEIAIKSGAANALHQFIHDNEPAGHDNEIAFRQGLAAVLAMGVASDEAADATRLREALRTMLREYDDNSDNEHSAVVHPAITIISVRAMLADTDRAQEV